MKCRKEDGRWTSSTYSFSGKIICGECGGIYGSKVWHSNTPHRTMVWQCNEKKRGQHCKTLHLTETEIQRAFLAAFNRILGNRTEIMETNQEVMKALTDTSDLDTGQEQLESESEIVTELMQKVITDNAQKAMVQGEYDELERAGIREICSMARRHAIDKVLAVNMEHFGRKTEDVLRLEGILKKKYVGLDTPQGNPLAGYREMIQVFDHRYMR